MYLSVRTCTVCYYCVHVVQPYSGPMFFRAIYIHTRVLYNSFSALLCLRILALFDTLWTLLTLHKSHLYLCYRADDIKDPATEPRTEELTRLLISRTE